MMQKVVYGLLYSEMENNCVEARELYKKCVKVFVVSLESVQGETEDNKSEFLFF